MIVLGIETSCDETSVGIVKNGKKVLALSVHSQIDQHSKFGGVVPEMASRLHVKNIIPVLNQALEQSEIKFHDVDLVAATQGPGLLGALSIGYTTGKALSHAIKKPFIGVNHLEGHIFANFLDTDADLTFPSLALIASGGHTQLIKMDAIFKYTLISNTLDDAIGEAFDKSARLLGLGYPGGPIIDKLAREGDRKAFSFPVVKTKNPLDFSFSGLKTAVLNLVNKEKLNEYSKDSQKIKDFCASLQHKLISELVIRTKKAAAENDVKAVFVAGGVSANSFLRESFLNISLDYQVFFPHLKYCVDNGAMIAAAGYYRYLYGQSTALDTSPKANLFLT